MRALRARACAFAIWVFVVRWRRVGAPVGSESDGGESDDELGRGRFPERRSVTTEKPRADHGGYAGCSDRIGNA